MLCLWKVFFLIVAITAKFKSISSTVSEYHKSLCSDYHRLNVVEAFSIHNGRTIIDDSPSFGPQPLKVCMVTFITKDILSYALYSLLLNRFYASLHNFDFFVVDSESGGQMELDGHDARWNKVKILHFAISSQSDWSSHCDYVLWVDADWTVLDMNWSITGLVSANPEAHILTSAGKLHQHYPNNVQFQFTSSTPASRTLRKYYHNEQWKHSCPKFPLESSIPGRVVDFGRSTHV